MKNIFRGLFGILLVVLSFLATKPAFAGYCMVTDGNDSSTDDASLRFIVETVFNKAGDDDACEPPSKDGEANDDSDYFAQVIVFATAEWGWENDVNKITLGSDEKKDNPLTFTNSSDNLALGNWAPEVVTDSSAYFEYDSSTDYYTSISEGRDYGAITINGKTNFSSGVSPLKCDGAVEIVVRHITIQTNAVSYNVMFHPDYQTTETNCLVDGGDVTVEAGFVDGDEDGYNSDEDCDDTNAAIHPDATEWCDEVDNDCDGLIDDDDSDVDDQTTWYADSDGDGYGVDDEATNTQACSQPTGYAGETEDSSCDGDATQNPGAEEICDDEIDQDCDGVDESEADGDECTPSAQSQTDDDGDGYCESTVSCSDGSTIGDCDDADALYHPDAEEACVEGTPDYDCDGSAGSEDAECSDTTDVDDDGDGYSEAEGDCDDANAARSPGIAEVCDDAGVDEDCDSSADDADSDCSASPDTDNDGDGYTENDGDCDDTASSIYPGAEEDITDFVDNDCDSLVDEIIADIAAEEGDNDGGGCSMNSRSPAHIPGILVVLVGLMSVVWMRRSRNSLDI
ncbi:MAG: hypothetical protein A3G32_08855 [Deltaproteobacteria bacterium RIFCSPLOWO2_12_FULL_40_28]|nr:MAG: hypothetical protein A3C45_01555 [Deltaproteobacteria bacterium RIFCSPHIGHO2_02_FULL_40_28]OGQ21010.1 MAG: hypothetical protein A3E27_04220 [Deltaproteobacteria bacterium RIFCSPHIGHO2_12_FULL_40_32]OGQ39411.1 MAG: hypothetical protein A3I69_05580 [Deltaproteobacteria bacterium RIFCSPLOWO2_02_FULL_40_36]OGQ54692.1 MAG: hypothetical protein A3G32_08855 [Deltaproteobacteria bacterium RIFCSPLOWO2_12_FULL_40_28]